MYCKTEYASFYKSIFFPGQLHQLLHFSRNLTFLPNYVCTLANIIHNCRITFRGQEVFKNKYLFEFPIVFLGKLGRGVNEPTRIRPNLLTIAVKRVKKY